MRIPKTLALIGSKHAVEVLYRNLENTNQKLRYEAIRSLNKLKDNYPMAKLDQDIVNKNILQEAGDFYRLSAVIYSLDRHSGISRIKPI